MPKSGMESDVVKQTDEAGTESSSWSCLKSWWSRFNTPIRHACQPVVQIRRHRGHCETNESSV